MVTLSDISRRLQDEHPDILDAGLGPVTNTTRAGRPNAFAAPTEATYGERLGDTLHDWTGLNRQTAGQLGGAFALPLDEARRSYTTLRGDRGKTEQTIEAASYTPLGILTKAGIIGAAGLKSLAKYGDQFRHADEWGGYNRIKPALEALEAGQHRADVWAEHGIAKALPDGTPMFQPFSYLPEGGMALKEGAFSPMTVGYSDIPAMRTNGSVRTIGDAVDWPEMFAAYPGLKDYSLHSAGWSPAREPLRSKGPGFPQISAQGAAHIPDEAYGAAPSSSSRFLNALGGSNNPAINQADVAFYGGGQDDVVRDAMRSTLGHEIGHIAQWRDNLPNGAEGALARPNYQSTPAAVEAVKRLQDLQRQYGIEPNDPKRWSYDYGWPMEVREAADAANQAGREATYWGDTGEKAARLWQSQLDGIPLRRLFEEGDPWRLPHINLDKTMFKPFWER